jgi:hypothetical protein
VTPRFFSSSFRGLLAAPGSSGSCSSKRLASCITHHACELCGAHCRGARMRPCAVYACKLCIQDMQERRACAPRSREPGCGSVRRVCTCLPSACGGAGVPRGADACAGGHGSQPAASYSVHAWRPRVLTWPACPVRPSPAVAAAAILRRGTGGPPLSPGCRRCHLPGFHPARACMRLPHRPHGACALVRASRGSESHGTLPWTNRSRGCARQPPRGCSHAAHL